MTRLTGFGRDFSDISLKSRPKAGVAVAIAVFVAVIGGLGALPSSAEGEAAVFRLKSGDNITQTIKSVNVADPGGAATTPADCRGDEAAFCDVVRVYLERDDTEGALNFLRVELTFDVGVPTPSLALVVAGLSSTSSNDLDMYVYDPSGAQLDGVGGATAAPVEVAGLVANHDYYDIVIHQFLGSNTDYTMNFIFSNEKFSAPFESLDPSTPGGFAPPVDRSGDPAAPDGSPGGSAQMSALIPTDVVPSPVAGIAVAPAAPDSDFTGFRAAIDDRLSAPIGATPASRSIARPGAPPSVAEMLFWLMIVPTALLAGTFFYVRRKQTAGLGR